MSLSFQAPQIIDVHQNFQDSRHEGRHPLEDQRCPLRPRIHHTPSGIACFRLLFLAPEILEGCNTDNLGHQVILQIGWNLACGPLLGRHSVINSRLLFGWFYSRVLSSFAAAKFKSKMKKRFPTCHFSNMLPHLAYYSPPFLSLHHFCCNNGTFYALKHCSKSTY